MAKDLSAMQETWVQFLGQEDPLEKRMATQSTILAWEIPWTESLVDFSPWVHKRLDTTEQRNNKLLVQNNSFRKYVHKQILSKIGKQNY